VILFHVFLSTQSERVDHIERIIGFTLVLEVQQAESFIGARVGQFKMDAEIERHPLGIASGRT